MNKIMQNKVLIAVAFLVVVLVAVFVFFYYKNKNEVVLVPDLADNIKNNLVDVPTIVPDKTDNPTYLEYMTLALKYKSQGDAGDKSAYLKAIETYQKGVTITKGKIWLPYLNIGNIYKILGDYSNADKAYDNGLKIAPDAMLYLAKIELYQSFMKKPFDEVNKLYNEAFKTTVENATLYINYASLLKENGYFTEALEIYKALSKSYPNNQNYKDEIVFLENKLK